MDITLRPSNIIIVGGSGGFGYATAVRMVDYGVNNLILGINDPNLSFSEINGFLQKLKMMAKDDKDCIEISCIILKETGYTTIND